MELLFYSEIRNMEEGLFWRVIGLEISFIDRAGVRILWVFFFSSFGRCFLSVDEVGKYGSFSGIEKGEYKREIG